VTEVVAMGDVLIRNVPDAVVERLKAQATRNSRSLQQELLDILAREAEDPMADFLERMRERHAHFRAEGRVFSDSTPIIRAWRDATVRDDE
jgi:plasmid stability protein